MDKNKLKSFMYGAAKGIAAAGLYSTGIGLWPTVGIALAGFIASDIAYKKITGEKARPLQDIGGFFLAYFAATSLIGPPQNTPEKTSGTAPNTAETTALPDGNTLNGSFNGACVGAKMTVSEDGRTVTLSAPGGCTINIAPQ